MHRGKLVTWLLGYLVTWLVIYYITSSIGNIAMLTGKFLVMLSAITAYSVIYEV